ncbi:Major allergen Alt a 1 [Plenodomus lingam]|uniref:Predicted protein n=1 Tax=Leptosphaeria maculans (strain JN3 / isolate v23.1.3 / race Av1-4-5-6-7-8) TaxID=985895 RepID=E4ZQ48_LEPMJ|nr:predicted protein [Plenodomus lingam JN3]KAH9874320.1 Major allergen Alt a 1 [Plenodomus lingam]CBX89958.1 predicted protein [Plenodomus lingam JN3]
MQFTTIAASLLAITGLSAAAPLEARAEDCPVAKTGDSVWKISELSFRKPDGKNINQIQFNIKATNNGTLDFNCGTQADNVEDKKFYECGENSFMWFTFNQEENILLLQHSVSDDIQYVGAVTLPNYCRAGGNGMNDFICTGVADAYMTLAQYPGLDRPDDN